MRVIVVAEARFVRTPDGAVWTNDGPANTFFRRYLSAFSRVVVLARVADVPERPPAAHRVDDADVAVRAVPYYVGPWQYLRRRRAVNRALREANDPEAMLILRAPTVLGTVLARARDRAGLPYAVEVMADPHAVFAPGVVDHPLRPLLRRRQTTALRRQCRRAVGVSYVTEHYLQRRYPAGAQAPTAAYSSVDLPPEAYVDRPRPATGRAEYTLVSLGTLEVLYKGVDTLIRAVARLRDGGTPVRLAHVGAGRCQPQLERLADELGVRDRIAFVGSLPAGEQVRHRLDGADLFVMPSRTEGLPKALVEAMARGLPAVGTSVGGIPELLDPADVVPPDDERALAEAIRRLLADPSARDEAARRNLARARDFSRGELTRRRNVFYRAVRDAAERRRHPVPPPATAGHDAARRTSGAVPPQDAPTASA